MVFTEEVAQTWYMTKEATHQFSDDATGNKLQITEGSGILMSTKVQNNNEKEDFFFFFAISRVSPGDASEGAWSGRVCV